MEQGVIPTFRANHNSPQSIFNVLPLEIAVTSLHVDFALHWMTFRYLSPDSPEDSTLSKLNTTLHQRNRALLLASSGLPRKGIVMFLDLDVMSTWHCQVDKVSIKSANSPFYPTMRFIIWNWGRADITRDRRVLDEPFLCSVSFDLEEWVADWIEDRAFEKRMESISSLVFQNQTSHLKEMAHMVYWKKLKKYILLSFSKACDDR